MAQEEIVHVTPLLVKDNFDSGGNEVRTIDPTEQRAMAEKDSTLYGVGFIVKGERVHPQSVTVVRKAYWPHVTTAELYSSLRDVLKAKGASDKWIEYALPDLQLAATQYASDQWAQGHASASRGEPLPNPVTTFGVYACPDCVAGKTQGKCDKCDAGPC